MLFAGTYFVIMHFVRRYLRPRGEMMKPKS